MSNDDLLRRLRNPRFAGAAGFEAAEQIKRLRAELAAERERANDRLTVLTAAIARADKAEAELAAERERSAKRQSAIKNVLQRVHAMTAERDAALANVAKLREALEPFAKLAEQIDEDGPAWLDCEILNSDLRRARAVLDETGGGDG